MKLLILGIFLFVLGALWVIYPVHRAIKKSEVLEAQSKAYEQHPQSPTMQILVMGDSTALGTGASRPELSIAGLVGAQYPSAEITNISRYGMQLQELLQKLETIPADQKYDLIIFQIGANDVTHLTPLSEVTETLGDILEKGEERSTKIILLSSGNIGLSPVFHFPLSTFISKRTREVREIYLEAARVHPGVSYIDLYHEKDDEIFNTDIDRYYAADQFHPSEHGYMVWFNEITKVLWQN